MEPEREREREKQRKAKVGSQKKTHERDLGMSQKAATITSFMLSRTMVFVLLLFCRFTLTSSLSNLQRFRGYVLIIWSSSKCKQQ